MNANEDVTKPSQDQDIPPGNKSSQVKLSEAPVKWVKPPKEIPIPDFRDFMAKYGHDVGVLVCWTMETRQYHVLTMGATRQNADSAVRLRNLLMANVSSLKGEEVIDRRDEHYNVKLSVEQIDYLLMVTIAERERGDEKNGDVIQALLSAKELLVNAPAA
jgi:hypothetical protein